MTPSRDSPRQTAGHEASSDERRTRRAFLVGTAAAGAGALGGCTGSGAGGGGLGGSPTETDATAHDDVDAVNFLLALSYLEHALYQRGLKQFEPQQLRNAEPVTRYSDSFRSALPDRLATIRGHEQRHAETLAATVEELGGEPVEAGEYSFDFDRPTAFFGTARVMESTVTAAYKGVAPAITTEGVLETVLSAHSVEGRHAAFLNLLAGKTPFPRAFDAPQSPRQVLQATDPFVESERQVADPTRRTDTGTGTATEQSAEQRDVAILNELLALEHVQFALYQRGLDRFGAEQLRSAGTLSRAGDDHPGSVAERLRTLRDQERSHVETLRGAVQDHGGEPTEPATYSFPLESPGAFLRTARELAPVAIGAYADALPRLRTESIFRAILQSHSVEGRHAAYLDLLAGEPPARTATVDPMSRSDVQKAITPYVDRRSS